MKSFRVKIIPAVLALALLSLIPGGCSQTSNELITFSKLISQADKYNGRTVMFEAYYFSGFEISALAGSFGPSNSGTGRIVPSGDLIWVEGGITRDIFNLLYTQSDTPSGYTEHLGKLKVTGIFKTGGQYGHLDAYQYQIQISSAELLEWSPPPASPAAAITGPAGLTDVIIQPESYMI
jgi:hypothetical protein